MTRKIAIPTILLVFCIFGTWAQEPVIDVYVKQSALPADIEPASIRALDSDTSGFIWLGTEQGVYRWDGQFAIRFSADLKEGTSERVNALSVGSDGRVWAGCQDGSIIYIQDRKVNLWRSADTSRYSGINDILMDDSGRLWWGTNGSGIYYFNGTQTTHLTTADGLPDNYIYNLEQGEKDEMLASTDNGLVIITAKPDRHQFKVFGTEDGLPDRIVRFVRRDAEDNYWMGFHNGGICNYNPIENRFRIIDSFGFGTIDHLEISGNSLWVTDTENGLVYIPVQPGSLPLKARISGNFFDRDVRMTHADAQGNLWLLGNTGLYVSSGGAFSRLETYQEFDLKKVTSLAFNEKEEMIVAEDGKLFCLSKRGTEVLLDDYLPATSRITDIQIDEYGFIWMATFGQGVLIMDPVTKKVHSITQENSKLINNSVLNISFGKDDIWVATLGGASQLRRNGKRQDPPEVIRSYDNKTGLSNNFIYRVLQDKKGNVWFASDGNGLVKFDGTRFSFFEESSGLGDDVIYSMDEDESGNIWISTSSSGVYRYDSQGFDSIGIPFEADAGEIYSLVCQSKYVFVLAESGLIIYDTQKEVITRLDEELDLRHIIADLNCAYKKGDQIYFPTRKGIIKVDVNHLFNFRLTPKVVIDRTMVNLSPVRLWNGIELSSDENQLVFEYTGHWYLAPRKVRFNIHLDGYEPDWKLTYDRRAGYASLPSGDYTFRLAAFNDYMQNVSEIHAVHFSILKPFYLRWWFILIVIMVLLGIFYFFLLYRENRLKLVETRKKEKLEFEFQTLKNQINPHFLFNSFSTLISMIEDQPKQAVEYADSLSDFFRNILEVKETELIPLREELLMLRNYYFIQKNRFDENLDMQVQLDENILESKIPPLSLQLLVENAVKHNIISRNKPLQIRVTNDDEHIIVSNNLQPKLKMESSTGLGLKNIMDRYHIITGKKVSIADSETHFTVLLPILD
ncbi:MAG: two-component regulator propeller domain-containing protein [bacterium]